MVNGGVNGGDAVTWDELLTHCLAKPGAWQDEPWDGDGVAKVSSKIFAFLGSPSASAVGVKCGRNREDADEWLLRYPGATPDDLRRSMPAIGEHIADLAAGVAPHRRLVAVAAAMMERVTAGSSQTSPATTLRMASTSRLGGLCFRKMPEHPLSRARSMTPSLIPAVTIKM